MIPALKPGDIFCTTNPMWLGRAINWVQAFNDPDDKSKYSHSGFLISPTGVTSEALWTIKQSYLSNYIGKPIIIGRHIKMTQERFDVAYAKIKHQEGDWYPLWRLPLFFIPPLAKYIHFSNIPVCSEWVEKLLVAAGLEDSWSGKNPNYVADMIIRWKEWEVIYEGIME